MRPPATYHLTNLRVASRAELYRWLSVAAAALTASGCRDTSIDPADQLSVREESAHYVYLHAPGDAVDVAMQERYYTWLIGQIGIEASGKLEYRKYRDRAHLRSVTGRNTNGFAEPGTVRFHTIWPWDNHEGVHTLVILRLGHPPALFNEGIAVAHQGVPAGDVFEPRWNGGRLDVIAADRLSKGQIPPLRDILESRGFFGFDEDLMYPVAGSFVRFLITRYGWAPLRNYFAHSGFEDSATQTRAAFLAAYGISVDDTWVAWQASLGTVTAP